MMPVFPSSFTGLCTEKNPLYKSSLMLTSSSLKISARTNLFQDKKLKFVSVYLLSKVHL